MSTSALTLPDLPDDPRLIRHIRESAARGALGHAIILSGRGDLENAARFAAAAMECEGENRPCGCCVPCRKIIKGIHPDFIRVEDPEHKNISVEVLRRVAADAYILPNEGKRKIYLFPDCNLLEPKAQNVLLKVVEEGPSHAAFLFCAENSSVLLPTIRSRAVEWKLTPPPDSSSGEAAQKLCALLCGGKTADMIAFCTDLETGKTSREELREMLSGARDLLARGLAACYTGEGDKLARQMAESLGKRRIAALTDILEPFIRQCNYNVGVGHLSGALAVALTV